ncbi:MAG: 5-(carboxyamino)imidazole ribonucleotide mutase [Chitinispirillaceae bacterium]|nr:5-(carboxyamino)imidazole ribonucleotide mutase [Chitinispirillaceae bacterium]
MLKVAIVMGSESDMPVAEKAAETLKKFDVEYAVRIISAHRMPNKLRTFALTVSDEGFGVIIAIAGLAAHLPGVIAGMTLLPVIGVPAATGPLSGRDALLSIVQMPPGIPVACVGIGNAGNAALLAVQMLSLAEPALVEKMRAYRLKFGDDAA